MASYLSGLIMWKGDRRCSAEYPIEERQKSL
jgi:hypothetical protein